MSITSVLLVMQQIFIDDEEGLALHPLIVCLLKQNAAICNQAPSRAVDEAGVQCATVHVVTKLIVNLRFFLGGRGKHRRQRMLPHTH